MEEQKRRKRREEEILETALAAAAAAIFISGLKKIFQYIDHIHIRCPSLLLLLLLHIIIATIVMISTRKAEKVSGRRSHCHRRSVECRKRTEKRGKKKRGSWKPEEAKILCNDEDGVDAEEVNARAEAFILAFRQQLRVDSFGSSVDYKL